ncbi:MAG: hypothetical protein LUG91_08830 [Ruminococcus sp.]|nr:hypothetical protein [Ruminococcus sp.]
MDAELKQQAESYLGTEIKQSEWDSAKAYAERKLRLIINSEGDSNGERRKPCYIAQLIAEIVRSNRFVDSSYEPHAEKMGIKKEQLMSI